MQGEVELVDRLEEGEVGAASQTLETGLLPSRHFFGQQESEKITIGPTFVFGSMSHLLVDPAHVRQVETPEEGLHFRLGEIQALRDLVVGRDGHRFTSRGRRFSLAALVPTERSLRRISRSVTRERRGCWASRCGNDAPKAKARAFHISPATAAVRAAQRIVSRSAPHWGGHQQAYN